MPSRSIVARTSLGAEKEKKESPSLIMIDDGRSRDKMLSRALPAIFAFPTKLSGNYQSRLQFPGSLDPCRSMVESSMTRL